MPLGIGSRRRGDKSEAGYPGTDRIEAFSDGVFAVAVTFLVFNLKLPASGESAGLGQLLLSQWPAYAGYVVTFVTVGIFWANHHYMFHYIKRSDHILAMLNVFFLMGIAFLPFPTALVATYMRRPSEQRTAVLVYVGAFLVCALLFTAVWLYAAGNRRLIDNGLDSAFVRTITRKYFLAIAAYAFALAAALLN
ncbi:MAG: TMEM175 family protein, partial [Candidatus Binataceae bacterium]